jgi:hypothetical protein
MSNTSENGSFLRTKKKNVSHNHTGEEDRQIARKGREQ